MTTNAFVGTSAKLVGQSVRVEENLDPLLGNAKYTADFKLPGMLYAAIYRSPYAHARIVSIDVSEALAIPGVVTVVTAETLPAHVRAMPPLHRGGKAPVGGKDAC